MSSEINFSLPVPHVSDTAWLVAAWRAAETARPDARFRDPLAALLVGDKFEATFAKIPNPEIGEWLMVVRTYLIDQAILKLAAEGTRTVVNLAAGLDTRPYRLTLPRDLSWIEVDLSGVIEYKNDKLASVTPSCRLKRIVADLSLESERRKVFSEIALNGERPLIVTEGLLNYLSETAVTGLSFDLAKYFVGAYWLMDFMAPDFFESFRAAWTESKNKFAEYETGETKFRFVADNGSRFFEPQGWSESMFQSFELGAQIIERPFPILFSNGARVTAPLKKSGVLLLDNSAGRN